ncbi:MAG: hypothetical protein WCE62_06270 [Polyangiales bacterium]
MKRNFCSAAGAIALLFVTSVVSAQGAWSYEPPPTQTYSSRPVEQYPAPPASSREPLERGLIGAFNIGVPIMLDVDSDVVRPGVDLNGFGGLDMEYVVFGLGAGAMWTPINSDQISGAPPGSGYGRSPMTRLYFSPEVRVQVPNKSPIVPYLGVTFDANWWRVHSYDVVACGAFYCRTYAVFLFTPGMTAKVGFAFKVSDGTYIDVGAKYSLSGPGNFFPSRQQWVTPYAGILFR